MTTDGESLQDMVARREALQGEALAPLLASTPAHGGPTGLRGHVRALAPDELTFWGGNVALHLRPEELRGAWVRALGCSSGHAAVELREAPNAVSLRCGPCDETFVLHHGRRHGPEAVRRAIARGREWPLPRTWKPIGKCRRNRCDGKAFTLLAVAGYDATIDAPTDRQGDAYAWLKLLSRCAACHGAQESTLFVGAGDWPTPRAPVRLEKTNGHKPTHFWEASLEGATLEVRKGKVGTDGKVETFALKDEDAALVRYDELLDRVAGVYFTPRPAAPAPAEPPKKEKEKGKKKAEQPAAATHRFELEEGETVKFWEIELKGVRTTTRYGVVGGTSSLQVKEHATEVVAGEYVVTMTADRVKRGFSPVREA